MLLENVCTLPLPDDVFALASHPTRPLITAGLASGHVHAFLLPAAQDADDDTSILSNGRGAIDTLWATRRHRGSCRAIAFSPDGEYGFSAGTDGLVKHYASETGRVVSKIAIPQPPSASTIDGPTVLHALTPLNLVLATDSGALHLVDLRASGTASMRVASTHRPHDDFVASVAALPATAGSTSGFPRQLVSVGATTLAVTDLRKGVIARSEDQEDELVSATFVPGIGPKQNRSNGMVAVGSGSGVVTLWDRGVWDDQAERIIFDGGYKASIKGPAIPAESVDALATAPESWGPAPWIVAGMGDGTVRCANAMSRVVSPMSLKHDDLEGVVALAFDSYDRLLSGGGRNIKVWEDSVANNEDNEDSEDDDDSDDDGNDDSDDSEPNEKQKRQASEDSNDDSDDDDDSDDGDSDDDDSDDDDSDSDKELARKRKETQDRKEAAKKARLGPMGAHGILAFDGLD